MFPFLHKPVEQAKRLRDDLAQGLIFSPHAEGVVAAVERARHPSNPMNRKLRELFGHWIPLALTGAVSKKKAKQNKTKQNVVEHFITTQLHSKVLDFKLILPREYVSPVLFSATSSSFFRKLSACA